MKSVSTGVSQCWDTFGLIRTSRVCQYVQTTVTVGLRHARMISPVMITGRRPTTKLPACLYRLIVVLKVHNAANLVKCLLMVKNCATECGEPHTATPLIQITVQL